MTAQKNFSLDNGGVAIVTNSIKPTTHHNFVPVYQVPWALGAMLIGQKLLVFLIFLSIYDTSSEIEIELKVGCQHFSKVDNTLSSKNGNKCTVE